MSQDHVTIRGGGPSDAAAVARLICETIDASYRGVYPDRAITFFKQLHERDAVLERLDQGTVLVADRQGVIVGTGSLVEREIGGVFVRTDLKATGIGTLLMDELEELAASRGLESVTLCVSLPSRGFYERRGYILSDLLSHDVGEGQTLDYWEASKPVGDRSVRRDAGTR